MILLFLLFALAPSSPVAGPSIDHDGWTALLQKSVIDDTVDYEALLRDRAHLQEYLELLAEAQPQTWTRAEQMAFWINAYNAVMVESVLDHWPLDSVLDISKILKLIPTGWVFHKKHRVAGAERSLNDIEHRILRGRFNDPRIHAAINCASVSCPPLLNGAFVPERLDAQLDSVMTAFILDKKRNHLHTRPPQLSKIFEWFRSDFEAQGSVWTYVRSQLPDSVSSELPAHANPDFLSYDWALNGRH